MAVAATTPGAEADHAAAEPLAASAPEAAFTWTRIADEYQSFTITGTQVARYGLGSTRIEREVTGSGDCSNALFERDPLLGVFKECQVQDGVAPLPPPPGGDLSARIVNIELAQSLLFPSGDSELLLLRGKATLVKVNAIAAHARFERDGAPARGLRVSQHPAVARR